MTADRTKGPARPVAGERAWMPTTAAAGFGVVGALALALILVAAPLERPAGAELPPAYELPPLPAGLDSATSLERAQAGVAACASGCATVVYAWTPRMPLSRSGIPHVAVAAERLGVALTLIDWDDLADYGAKGTDDGASLAVAEAMLLGGALAHAPALAIFSEGVSLGSAILGYKTADAWAAAIERRLDRGKSAVDGGSVANGVGVTERRRTAGDAAAVPTQAPALTDFPVIGVPGAYFRWVPGRDAIAYEASQRVFLLDLGDGESRVAPGFIDFVPTPDGRYFVTPGEVDGGLTFYDAGEVFAAVERGRPGEVEPIFTDLVMRDQYPSIGILEQDATRTLYRVMTSWFEGVVYRDYDVRVDAASGASSVRPASEPVRPCQGVALSTPIMAQDGREVAGRDEATGTTKIFRILEGGRCEALTDFGVATSKVAWHSTGRKVAFSVPRRRRGADEADQGIFVLDRDARELTRVPGSEGASRLAFPDFVGVDAVVFLVPGTTVRDESVFRVVEFAP